MIFLNLYELLYDLSVDILQQGKAGLVSVVLFV